MENQLLSILNSVFNSFKDIWPFLLLTIPLAVLIQLSGVSRHIKRILGYRPVIAIILATLIGAFSPFCSCGVIPIIATLLISGVPLAPVMAFWIASPSMDPEIFFLSVATLGWDLAIWRLVSTMLISLSAGFITHYLINKKWLDETSVLRTSKIETPRGIMYYVKLHFRFIAGKLYQFPRIMKEFFVPEKQVILDVDKQGGTICCKTATQIAETNIQTLTTSCSSCNDSGNNKNTEETISYSNSAPFLSRLLKETWNATFMVLKFMALSFLLTALIKLYIPREWITGLIGGNDIISVFLAAIIGVPFYTSSLAALPLISGLLSQGMSPAAALAFLIAGPTTTFPAMAAVWGLTSKRTFLLYLSFSLFGALFMGFVYLVICSL
jgi:uncharacterized membrane protein YraQ (UPF0718 family)